MLLWPILTEVQVILKSSLPSDATGCFRNESDPNPPSSPTSGQHLSNCRSDNVQAPHYSLMSRTCFHPALVGASPPSGDKRDGTQHVHPSKWLPQIPNTLIQVSSISTFSFFFPFFLTFNVDERSRGSKPVTTQMFCMFSLWNGEVGIFYLRSSVIIEEESYFILLNSTPPTTAKKVIIKK